MNKCVRKKIPANCLNCPHHDSQTERIPYDDFGSDAKKVLCEINGKLIAWAATGEELREECERPYWCPLIPDERKEEKSVRKK